jgi:hypothetical protein
VRRAPCIFYPIWILAAEKCKWVCLPPCNHCLVGRCCSNLVVESRDEILFKGVGCDALGFHLGSINLMMRSNQLTLVKQGSTWAITSKTQPTTPSDQSRSTLVKLGQNPSQRPLKTLWHPCQLENFCRVLQISSKHFEFSECKSCVVCRGTQLSCWVACPIRSGIRW